MYILGIHYGHDSSAALIQDGRVVAAVSEERFTRIKHHAGLPWKSVAYCLKAAGIEPRDINVVAVPSRQMDSDMRFMLSFDVDERKLNPSRVSRAATYAQRRLKNYVPSTSNQAQMAQTPAYMAPFNLGLVDFVPVEHHLAHAASAYYTGGMNGKTLVVTSDGIGDEISLAVWVGENGKLDCLMQIGAEGSLGWFYGVVTEALGWWHGDGEGTVMGLAAYGNPDKAKGSLDWLIPRYQNGKLVKPHDFGVPGSWNEKGAWHWHLKEQALVQDQIKKYGREDLAAEAQRLLEEQMLDIIPAWMERTETTNVACAGGVFQNVKMNQRLWEHRAVEGQFIYPNPGDGGLAVGAALYAYFMRSGDARIPLMQDVYSGPQFTNAEIEDTLKVRKIPYRQTDDIAAETARLLAAGEIVGWFQGRMEFGPRALGARSILMDPRKAENKDIINARVKYREPFRPFCPSMLAEATTDYLPTAREDPFMITSFDVRAERWQEIPSVVHVDGTVRPQAVKREVNDKYWRMIHGFGELTGTPVVLNTSMNIKGEPIICTPHEAVVGFFGTGMDYLAIGDYLVGK